MDPSQRAGAVPAGNAMPSPGALRVLFSLELAILLVIVGILLGVAVFFAQFSGILRWLLFIVILILGGWIAGKFIRLRTIEVEPLGPRKFQPEFARGALQDLSASLRRGSRGLRYSQLHFAVALRDAFLGKLRATSGFRGTIQELKGDLPLLRTLCADEEIFRFLRRVTLLERSMAKVLSSPGELFPEEPRAFPQHMEDLFARMEAWP